MDIRTNSSWRRVIVPAAFHSEKISDGVTFARFHPGGLRGPNDELHFDTPGGQTFSEQVHLGRPDDEFELGFSHVRMPANQVWPMHWHDCDTVVLCLEGSCLIGDFWMQPGDILIVEPELEYGPLISGPNAVRIFEIFSKAHLAPGGYASEYHDHPTLQTLTHSVFEERAPENKRNDGNQTLSCDASGLSKSHILSEKLWNLGKPDDPDRGIMAVTDLDANETRDRHDYADWHFVMVLEGSITIEGRTLGVEDHLIIAPKSALAFTAGPDGAKLFEVARTVRGAEPRMLA